MNRFLLGLLGLVLLAAGGAALAGHRRLDQPLVPGAAAPPTWVLATVAAGAGVLALLCLRWLFAQVPRTRATTWRWTTAAGTTRMTTTAATAPFADEIAAYPGVRKVEAALTGPHTAPSLALVIRTRGDADLRAIRGRVDDEGLPRLRQALESPELLATVEFRMR